MSGQSGAVELLLEARPTAVGLAEVGDELIHLDRASSADGRRLAFNAGSTRGSDIYLICLDGSGLRQVTRDAAANFYPSRSPDGRRLAFSSNRDGDWDIFVIELDGSNVRQLVNSPGWTTNRSGRRRARGSVRDHAQWRCGVAREASRSGSGAAAACGVRLLREGRPSRPDAVPLIMSPARASHDAPHPHRRRRRRRVQIGRRSTVVVDVKPARMCQEPKVAAVLDWTGRLRRARGWRYEVFHGESPIVMANLRFLAHGRRSMFLDQGLRRFQGIAERAAGPARVCPSTAELGRQHL